MIIQQNRYTIISELVNFIVANYFQLDINYGVEHGDPMDFHAFTVVNNMRKGGKIFLDYVPTFTKKQSQYQAVLRAIIDPEDQLTFK